MAAAVKKTEQCSNTLCAQNAFGRLYFLQSGKRPKTAVLDNTAVIAKSRHNGCILEYSV